MGDKTGISWTSKTLNVVTGCEKVSPGCGLPRFDGDDTGGCYAMALARRLKAMGSPKYQKDGEPPLSGPGFGVTLHPKELNTPLRWRDPTRVFVCSMSDLFNAEVPTEFIAKLWAVMAMTPQHVYQILTKRHGRLAATLGDDEERFRFNLVYPEIDKLAAGKPKLSKNFDGLERGPFAWPLPNVHVGVSAEDQKWFDIRYAALRKVPAAVRWVSLEPLLGPIDLGFDHRRHNSDQVHGWPNVPVCMDCSAGEDEAEVAAYHRDEPTALGWCVVGGESGPDHREMNPAWLESIARQCQNAGVACHVKQDSGPRSGLQGRIPDALWSLKQFPAEAVSA